MPPPTQGRSSAQQPADEAYISSLVMAICLYGAVSRQVVIIGGGIVGAALAAYLCEHEGVDVTVIERGPNNRLVGSTGLAPGFVGLLGETPVMTGLARASADCYERLEHDSLSGFDRVGGLEVASTPAGMADLERRAALAHDAGLPADVCDTAQAMECEPVLVGPDSCVGGVLYPDDGTARAEVVTAALKDSASSAGTHFVFDAAVTAIDVRGDQVRAVRVGEEAFVADDIVIACGIWGPAVAALAGRLLALTPVAHPYVYGAVHGRSAARSPFVRWPEHHVYARDHGDRLGLGTYDHAPLAVAIDQLGAVAGQPWPAALFDPAVARALDLLPPDQRFAPERRVSGVFSMTADNLPLLGPIEEVRGLWAAEALWVTHAAGAARALAQMMTGTSPGIPGLEALRPGRFTGQRADDLNDRALRMYRDIYATA